MYHLFNRIYLGVDVMRNSRDTFYLASKEFAGSYSASNVNGPNLIGLTVDEEAFIDNGFVKLLNQSLTTPDDKLVIYTSLSSYITLISKWLRAVFPNASNEQIKTLLYFELLTFGDVNGDILTLASEVEPNRSLTNVVNKVKDNISLEYKLLNFLAKGPTQSIAKDIRVFALRSMKEHILESTRNMTHLFFSGYMQEKYDYVAIDHLGKSTLLKNIPKLKILNSDNLLGRLETLDEEEQQLLIDDLELYLGADSHIGKSQLASERAKLKIINKAVVIDDDEVTNLFVDMLRSSTEHTDYLDWSDVDKVKVHLIHWAVGLDEEDCKGYEI